MTGSQTGSRRFYRRKFSSSFSEIGSFRANRRSRRGLHPTVNQVLMHFRRERENEKTSEDGETQQIVLETERINRECRFSTASVWQKRLSELPPGYWKRLLHDVEGYEHEAVARILKISVWTSKSRGQRVSNCARCLRKRERKIESNFFVKS